MKVTYTGETVRNNKQRKVTYTGDVGTPSVQEPRKVTATYVGRDQGGANAPWHTSQETINANREYFRNRAQAEADEKQNVFSRLGKAVGAGALGTAAGFTEIAAQATPTSGEQSLGQFSGFGDLGRAVRESRETGEDINAITKRIEQQRIQQREAEKAKTYETADMLTQRSAELQERAKAGAGSVGGFLLDLATTGTQMAGDAAMNILMPGSGLAAMGARVYGQSAGDARREGKTEAQQITAGIKGAAIEVLTEKLFGGLAKAYGAGTADELVGKIADKLTKTEAGKRAAVWLINSGGEGIEEVLSDIANPLADRVLGLDDGTGAIFTTDDAAQMGYDFLLGSAMGAIGGAGQLWQGAKASRDVKQNTAPEINGKAAEAVEALRQGKNITGNQAAAIAKDPIAVAALEQSTGVQLDTEKPISQLKRDIAALSGRERAKESVEVPAYTPRAQKRTERTTGGFMEAGQQAYNTLRQENGSAEAYAGFSGMYNAGLNGIDAEQAGSRFTEYLTPEQRYAAYNAGLQDAATVTARENAEVKRVTVDAGAGLVNNEWSRTLIAYDKPKAKTLNEMGKKLGVRIEFVESVAGGKANGQYVRESNTIQIALDADNPIMAVAAHEITHRMQDLAPEEYRAYRKAAMEHKAKEYGADSVTEAVERYRQRGEDAGVKLTKDQAMDEMAADFTRSMIEDADLFAEFTRSNRTAAQKLLDSIKEFIAKVRGLVTGKARDAAAQDAFGTDFSTLEKAAEAWQRAFDAAEKTAEGAKKTATEGGEAVQDVGIVVDTETESANPGRFSLKTWNESDYVQKRNEAAEDLSKALGVSVRTAKKYIDDINSVAKIIADDRVRLDYEASPGRSSFVGNSEYGGSLDFSTICKKRRLLTGTLEAIQSALPNTALTADEILSIRRMMADKGYEVSCGLCYVEGSRAKMGVYTKEFLEEYAKTGAEYVPNMAEMNTATGQERIRAEHPEVYEAYEKYMNKLAQRKPKLYQLATEYQGEIRKKFKGKGSVEEKNKNGGMRLQSFSDFEIIHLIDCMQAILDMSDVGLAGQAYTKVPNFAWALGDTGLKINLSLIAKGVDANGNIVLDETEGMPRSDAEALRKKYSGNVGTILVTFNDEQLLAAMKSDFIDFIIPFHRSQWNSAQYETLGLPQGAKDYTPWQNESYIEPVYSASGKKQRPANYMPNEYWDFSKSGKENAEKYLQMCAANNRKPKFSFLLDKGADGAYHLKADSSTDGYWKLLIDFKMYDNAGKGSPQIPVVPKFNMSECERMLREYTGGHTAFPVANDVVDQFVDSYKNAHPGIRYQLRGTADVEQELRDLKKERTALRSRNKALEERVQELKGETRISKEPAVVQKDVKKLGREIIRQYGSDVSYADIEGDMTSLGKAVMRRDVSMQDLMPHARAAAEKIVDNTVEMTEYGGELLDIKDYLKRQKILFNGEMNNYEDFRRSHMGTLKLNKKEGIPVDTMYSEMTELFGEGYFPSDIYTEADKLQQIADVLDSTDAIYRNPFEGYRDMAVQEIANEIVDGMLSDQVRQKKTFADRKALEKQEAVGRVRQLLAKEQQKRKDMVQRMRREYSEKTKAGREKRNAAELRGRIARHTGPISRKLLNPTDKQHIPEELRVTVARLLKNINLESAYSYDENGRLRKNAGGDPTKRTLEMEKLKRAYNDILEREGNLVVDPALTESGGLLDTLAGYGDKRIADMSYSELETVWNAIRAVERTLTSYDRTLSNAKYESTSKWAQTIADGSMGRIRRDRRLSLDMADPYTFFSAYGEGGMQVYRTLRDAQDREHVMLTELREEASKFLDSDVYKSRDERHTFTTGRGQELTLTTGQIMNLYNLARRGEQAMNHLTVGGIVQPEIARDGKLKAIKRGNENIPLTAEDIQGITKVLTPEQKRVADGLQKLASTKLAQWGNEASMQVYGYRKFKEEHYWPIQAAKDATNSSVEKGPEMPREIKNMGSAKALTPNASNALDIGSVYDVFAQNASDMIKYSTLLAPMEDINRLYNFRYRDSLGNLTGRNMRQVLSGVYGDAAQKYWRNLMRDMQNGMQKSASDTTRAVERLVGNTKGAAVGANVRVVVQQPTAYFRAAVVLDPEYMVKGLAKGVTAGNGWDKARKYAAIAGIKDTSGFDQGSRYTIAREVYGSDGGFMEKLNDISSWGAAKADAVTWGKIWNACEWQVAENANLEVGSDAYYKRVAEVFTDVIDQTQVVDGIMQRTQIMRDSDALTRQATSFMGEPLKSLNILMRTYDAWRYETSPQKRCAALKQMKRAVGALLVTDVMNALAQSLVDGLRDDDKDKKYVERVWEAFTGVTGDEKTFGEALKNVTLSGNVKGNITLIGRIPYAKDIISILQGYTVDRMDAGAIDDIVKATKSMIASANGSGKKTAAYNAKQLITMVSKVFGVSAANLGRDLWSIARSIASETDNVRLMYEMEKAIYRIDPSAGNRKRFAELLYRAQKAGDSETARYIYRDMLANGDDAEKIKSSVESIMKKEQGVNSVNDLKTRWRAP